MSLTTKPPAGDAGARADTAPAGGARAAPLRAAAPDAAAALRLLVEEILSAAVVTLGPGPRLDPAPATTDDPRQAAVSLLAWLRLAASATGAAPERIAAVVERAYARVLEVLARLPNGPGADSVRLTRDLLLVELGGGAADARPRALEAPALRILVEELKSAVVAELGAVEPPPRPASGAEAGNVAAALLRWMRATAAASNVPLSSLQGAAERALERTADALRVLAVEPPAAGELARAREVLLGALAREAPAPAADTAPRYRPDLPVPALLPQRAAPRDRGRVPRAPRESDPESATAEDDAREQDAGERPAALADLKGPMELIRRYFEDFHSPLPGTCARHFVYPACTWQAGVWQGHADAAALSAAYEALRQQLSGRDVAGGRILMLRVEPVGTTVAIVHALMTRESKAGAVLEELEVAYTTVRTAAGWRIAVLMRS